MIMVNIVCATDTRSKATKHDQYPNKELLRETQDHVRLKGVKATQDYLLELKQGFEKKSFERRTIKALLQAIEEKGFQAEIDEKYLTFNRMLLKVNFNIRDRKNFAESFYLLFNSFLDKIKDLEEDLSANVKLYDRRTLEKKEVRLIDIKKGIENFIAESDIKKFSEETQERFTRYSYCSHMQKILYKNITPIAYDDIFIQCAEKQPKMKLDYTRFALEFVHGFIDEYLKKYFFTIESGEILSDDQIAKNNYINYLIEKSDEFKLIIKDRHNIAKKFEKIFGADTLDREQYDDIERVLELCEIFLTKYSLDLSKKRKDKIAKILQKLPKDESDVLKWQKVREFGVKAESPKVKPESSEDQGRLNARSRSVDSEHIKRSGSEHPPEDADNISIKSSSSISSPERPRVSSFRQSSEKRRSISISLRAFQKNPADFLPTSPTRKESQSPNLSRGSSTEAELLKSSRAESKKRSASDASSKKKSHVTTSPKDKAKSQPESKSGSTDSDLKKSSGTETLRKNKAAESEATNIITTEGQHKPKKAPTRITRSKSSTSNRRKIKPIAQENSPEGVKSEEGKPRKNQEKKRAVRSCEDKEAKNTPVHLPQRIKDGHRRLESGEGFLNS